jgi:hypothetical protein
VGREVGHGRADWPAARRLLGVFRRWKGEVGDL